MWARNGARPMASLWGRGGESGKIMSGTLRTPGNLCDPREAAHGTKKTGPPIQRIAPAVAPVPGTGCLCTSKQGRERASICEYRRLQMAGLASYSARSWSSLGDVFSRQLWKHSVFIVNNAPPHPPHSPNHGALVPHLSGLAFSVGAQSGGRSEAHPWPGSSWHSPRDHNPGRWSRAERAERAGAEPARSRRGCRQAPRASSTPSSLPQRPPENYLGPTSGSASQTTAEPSPQTQDLAP